MKQYCRYCTYLCYGDVPYCSVKNKVFSEQSCKTTNKCKDFSFNSIDAFGETSGYKPRPNHKKYEYCGNIINV